MSRACAALLSCSHAPVTAQEALFKGTTGKVPKAVAACVETLLQSLRAFGPRIIKPTPLLKAAGPLFDHKDKAVRDGVKDIAVRPLTN